MVNKNYPEHEKLQKVRDKSHAVGEFIEWLRDQDIALCIAHEHTEDCENENGYPRYTCGLRKDEYMPIHKSIETLLAEFFGIDAKILSAEKEDMLEELRR
jgi:hypothetical protein